MFKCDVTRSQSPSPTTNYHNVERTRNKRIYPVEQEPAKGQQGPEEYHSQCREPAVVRRKVRHLHLRPRPHRALRCRLLFLPNTQAIVMQKSEVSLSPQSIHNLTPTCQQLTTRQTCDRSVRKNCSQIAEYKCKMATRLIAAVMSDNFSSHSS